MKPTLGQIFGLSLLGLAAVLAVLFYIVFHGSRQTIMESSNRIRDGASREISERVTDFLSKAPETLRQFQRELNRGLLDARDPLAVEPALFGLLLANSDIGELTFTYGELSPLAAKLEPRPQVGENVEVARVMNLLSHYTGKPQYRELARHAMRYLSAPSVGENHGFEVGDILLTDHELNTPPLQLTIVGRKDDAAARSLFHAASAHRATYKRVEWWDHREGNLPNPDVQYPELNEAAAFVCTDRSCSPPMFDPAKLSEFRTKRR